MPDPRLCTCGFTIVIAEGSTRRPLSTDARAAFTPDGRGVGPDFGGNVTTVRVRQDAKRQRPSLALRATPDLDGGRPWEVAVP